MTKDEKWLEIARTVALTFSKDPTTKVGAVIVTSDNRRASFGYNGFPTKIADAPHLLNDRAEKLKRTIHADINAILNATCDLNGCTMYVWPFPPCHNCALHIIQVGITRVVAPNVCPERWAESIELTKQLFIEAGVSLDVKDFV